ncbi:glycosyltransferase family 4 protein [Tenacibaculum sp. IB213877]|uniref:glycosyltransferase family 4 protein n=1 Tax=Tenacibaculum sp. IB213877 TaxID=3097351 RepID=UPI002A5AA7B4|nr:glycosyltransferase family 4 protein [Tenacibaculum sp. IB213877]MDY0780091.1 glycosyltransferase family 4 protein [Tenacibaculum sp. IB213877]
MPENLHILFLCGWYPSRVLPTNGDFIQRHAEAVSLQHKVSVIHIITDSNLKKDTEYTFDRINGVDTYIAYLQPQKNVFLKGLKFFTAFKQLVSMIDDFDLIHLHELYPFGLFTFLIKKPYIITEHWTGYHNPQSKHISNSQLFLSKFIAKKSKFICPVTKDLQKSMNLLGLKGNYKTVPNVVDTNLFFPHKKKRDSIFTILHISNMVDAHKNVSGLLNAISNLNFEYKLVLIGENSIKYKNIATNLNIYNRIEFVEHISHIEIPNYFNTSDVFVLFSNYENLPCVILESFACGTPVISTNVGGISEFFPKEFGFLIEKNNEEELIKNLTYLFNNRVSIREKMHIYAKQKFSRQSIAEQFTNLYKKALS